MAFTSVEVLTKSLEEQGWIDEPRWDTPLADIKEERRQAAAERATEEKKAEENKPKVIWPDEYTSGSLTRKQQLEKRKEKAKEIGITYEEYMDQYYRSKYENDKEVTGIYNSYDEYMYDHYKNMELYQNEPSYSNLGIRSSKE